MNLTENTIVTTRADVARARARARRAVRDVLEEAGATELVTPVMCRSTDLAPMPQFRTSHPVTGDTYFMRIAPEEHLTRFVATEGIAVYEIATNFRAEISDATHLIEFESLEALFPETTVEDMRALATRIGRSVFDALRPEGSANGDEPFGQPVPVISLPEWFENAFGAARDALFDAAQLSALGEPPFDTANASLAALADALIGMAASGHGGAVFVADLPWYLDGPAHPAADPRFLARSELYLDGIELGSVATQLADARALRDRYAFNRTARVELGYDCTPTDPAVLHDLDRIAPYGGLGLGLDRLVQLGLGLPDIRQTKTFA